MRASRTIKIILPLMLLAGALYGFNYLRDSRPQQPEAQPREKVWLVDVVDASPARLAPSITLYGKVETPTLLRPAAPGPGFVRQVNVREGQKVSPQQVLLELDPRDFEPAVAEARAEVLDMQAQLVEARLRKQSDVAALEQERRLVALAENALDRAQLMKKQNLGSESTMDQAEEALGRQQLALSARKLSVDSANARIEQLVARLERGKARLAQAELGLSRTRVVAPFEGVVTAVEVAAGDRVQASQILLNLYPVEGLEVRAKVATRYQDVVQSAITGAQRLRADAELAGRRLTLELVRLAGEADPSGVDAFFAVQGSSSVLRPGNLLELELSLPAIDDVIAVPFQAVYGNKRVYVLRESRMLGIDVDAVGRHFDAEGGASMLIHSDRILAGEQIITTHLPNAVTGLKVEAANIGVPAQRAPAAGDGEAAGG